MIRRIDPDASRQSTMHDRQALADSSSQFSMLRSNPLASNTSLAYSLAYSCSSSPDCSSSRRMR